MLDLVLVGGGLANCLIGWRLAMTRPDVSFALVEAGGDLGGNHTWSFHGTDVTEGQLGWLWPLVTKSWPAHDVVFGSEIRRLGGGYHSILSTELGPKVREFLKDRVRLKTRALSVSNREVKLSSGEVLEARAVIDGRGFSTAPTWPCGYQKFLGQEVELDRPHGLEVPLIMDARVDQRGAFRFMYLLPWDAQRVLVEDTSYADTPDLDLGRLRGQIGAYLGQRGLRIARVIREEAAALPIPLEGEPPVSPTLTVGVAGGLFNATTGYSLPMAVEVAEQLCQRPSLDAEALRPWLDRVIRAHWRRQGFFRLLNRMLFRGCEPEERVKIFDSFYRHSDELIGRFYAGRLSPLDKLKVLQRGAPTVPGPRAFRAAFGKLPPAPAPV